MVLVVVVVVVAVVVVVVVGVTEPVDVELVELVPDFPGGLLCRSCAGAAVLLVSAALPPPQPVNSSATDAEPHRTKMRRFMKASVRMVIAIAPARPSGNGTASRLDIARIGSHTVQCGYSNSATRGTVVGDVRHGERHLADV